MSEQFTITQSISFGEFIQLGFHQLLRLKIVRIIFVVSIIISILNAVLNISFASAYEQLSWVFILQLFFLPVFLIGFFSVMIVLISTLLLVFKPDYFKSFTYHFNHWGMQKQGLGGDFNRPWRGFIKYKESKNYFFLYITENDAHIIKKRSFESFEQSKDFANFLDTHIGKQIIG